MSFQYGAPKPTDPEVLAKYNSKLRWQTILVTLFGWLVPKLREEKAFKIKCEQEAVKSKLQLEELLKKRKEEKQKRIEMFKQEKK